MYPLAANISGGLTSNSDVNPSEREGDGEVDTQTCCFPVLNQYPSFALLGPVLI